MAKSKVIILNLIGRNLFPSLFHRTARRTSSEVPGIVLKYMFSNCVLVTPAWKNI